MRYRDIGYRDDSVEETEDTEDPRGECLRRDSCAGTEPRYYVTLPRERRPPLPFLPPSLLPLPLLLLLLQGPTSTSFDISAGVQRLTDHTRARAPL